MSPTSSSQGKNPRHQRKLLDLALGGYGRAAEYNWRFDRQRSAGILGDLGAHMIDFARWQVGEIACVSAHLATFVERPGAGQQPLDPATDAAMLLLEFENGAQGLIQVSAVAHVADREQEQHVSLHGAAGTLEVDVTFTTAEVRGARHDDGQIGALPVPDDLWRDADRSNLDSVFVTQPVGDRLFIEAILENRRVAPSFFEGYKAQQVIEAALASQHTGCWVAVT
jgi:predicted dehydrogenase